MRFFSFHVSPDWNTFSYWPFARSTKNDARYASSSSSSGPDEEKRPCSDLRLPTST
ncbi:MAG TPA: hypothetical protein VF339_05820 [Gammaproteobacteria bacterium]